jgi:hypothetical protein
VIEHTGTTHSSRPRWWLRVVAFRRITGYGAGRYWCGWRAEGSVSSDLSNGASGGLSHHQGQWEQH